MRHCARFIYGSFSAFTLSFLYIASAAPVRAQEVAFCQAYADSAIMAVKGSNQYTCGFGGDRYAVLKAAHFDACMGWGDDAGLHAIVETNTRTRDMSKCLWRGSATRPILFSTQGEVPGNHMPPVIHSFCHNYADIAVQQVAAMQELKCGFSGARWDTSFNAHRDACLAGFGNYAISTVAARETISRTWDVRKCEIQQIAAKPNPPPAPVPTPETPGNGPTHKADLDVNYHDEPMGNVLGFIKEGTKVRAACNVNTNWCEAEGLGFIYGDFLSPI